jgi:hypothetical protein
MGKRTAWISIGSLTMIGVISLFLKYEQITMACVVAIASVIGMYKDDKVS